MRRRSASFAVLVLGVASSCAGATELSAVEEADPPSAAAAVGDRRGDPEPEPATVEPIRAANAPKAPTSPEPREEAEPPPFDSRYAEDVRQVVQHYEAWGRIDDEARWAPWLCRMPRAASAHVSRSDDPKTHGHKLYTLYALDPVAYGGRKSDGPGHSVDGWSQVIVKESFAPVPIDADSKVARSVGGGVGPHRLQPAHRDGHSFMAGDPKGLYVMMKTSQPTAGTDEGWVYATVEPDGMTITAVGQIDSCMGCHAEAGQGRLFGLPSPPQPSNTGNRLNGPPL